MYGKRHGFLFAYMKASSLAIPILCIYFSLKIYRYLFKQKILRSFEQNIDWNIQIEKSSFFIELLWSSFKLLLGIGIFLLLFIFLQSSHDKALKYFTNQPNYVLFPCSVSENTTEEMHREIKKFWGKTKFDCGDDFNDESKW